MGVFDASFLCSGIFDGHGGEFALFTHVFCVHFAANWMLLKINERKRVV